MKQTYHSYSLYDAKKQFGMHKENNNYNMSAVVVTVT